MQKRRMSTEMEFDANEEKLKTLCISSLDEEEDDEAQVDETDDPDLYNDEDDDDEEQVPVTLGFVEKPKNTWSLLRHYFPSKAGGTPAWLDPINLPSEKSSLCDFCGEPLQFLLQVYAPLTEESTFHRTLFVFMCPSMACLLHDQHEQWKRHPEKPCRSVKVFRCQLPRTNSFYSSNAPSEDGTEQHLTAGATLCNWCGTWKGDKVCSSCRKARYCSGKHQAAHWRSGHRLGCTQLHTSLELSESAASNSLWPQYVITNEDECEFEHEMSDSEYSNALVSGNRVDESVKSLMNDFAGDDDKRSWASFQEIISRAPEQVLRYCRSAKAKALWPVHSGRPSRSDIPACNYCGGTRVFEFQVLPQLLYYFGVQNDVDSLDWATIVVYTCEASCKGDEGYKEEFAWVQLASQSAP
ncbi:programmed cell death protein 2-like isoform X2 [Olea europaea var. sylvestris]|uniref:programmed cell death protein 2-like isoform X2 n=1 Tax=Olea europaea var. sylvestris TaxID=158386 RepID=UPI000C1D1ADA|nr:programmed cell death protein 2-like isoform X2 [Olea europaea var. sylvestris]